MLEVNRDSGGETLNCCECGQVYTYTRRRTRSACFRNMWWGTSSLFVAVVVAAVILAPEVHCSSGDSGGVVVSQSEVKTVEPTNNPTKVFVRRRIFRKLVKESGANVSSNEEPTTKPTTSTARPRTLYSLVKRVDSPSSSVTGDTLKSQISNSQSLASRQKFNFQSLKTRLGLAASGIVDSTTPQPPTTTTQNSSLVMIPLPPSQRKPYTPVIMQVSKSTTSKPTMSTYKLNKMFVPIGIYGKVLENGTDGVTEGSSVEAVASSSSTPSTSIRHKGTDSGEKQQQRKVKGIADSVDITYGRPNLDRVSLTTQRPDIDSISITTEANELFSGLFSNSVRRGDNRNKYSSSSGGMTLMTPPKLGEEQPSESIGSYSSYSSYNTHNPHKKFTPSSIVDSITDSMSRIPSLVPSLFHKGLTSLASMTSSLKENPFVDDNFDAAGVPHKHQKPLVSAPSSYVPKIPASVPGGYISGMGSGGERGSGGGSGGGSRVGGSDSAYAASEIKSSVGGTGGVDLSDYETLEYFRKRPHLLQQLKKQRALEMAWRREHGVRLSKGFKPVNAPEHLAREYYKSTSTTASTPEELLLQNSGKKYRSAKRGSWLLRNSNEYVASKNDKVVRMWRDMLDQLTAEDDAEVADHPEQSIRRIDSTDQIEEHESPIPSSISARRSTVSVPKPNIRTLWSSIKRKYSKDQINEAKERILTLLDSGYGDEALHEIADDEELQHQLEYDTASHMPPPPPPRIKALSLTKGLSGAAAGAFKDLVKFFKLGVSVGTGHSREPVNYEQVVDEQEAEEVGSDWKPVRRPLISFSAGISLKNPTVRTQQSHVHAHAHAHESYDEDSPLTHYSSSSKPYIPSGYKGLNSHVHELATTHVSLKPTPYSYTEEEIISSNPSQSIDYEDDDSVGYGSATSPSYASQPTYASYAQQAQKHRYSTLKSGSGGSSTRSHVHKHKVQDSAQHQDLQSGAESTWQPVSVAGVNPNEYELVPSSVYLNGQHDPRDIAAVVKPAGISDEMVRSALPAGLRNLRILDYPNGYGASSLNSISQVLGGKGAVPQEKEHTFTSFKHAMKKLRENYVAKENAYLPPVQDEYSVLSESSGVRGAYVPYLSGLYSGGGAGLSNLGATYYNPVQQSGFASALSNLENGNVFVTADRINNLGRGTSNLAAYTQQHVESPQKDALGFSSNYNLPSNLDPDIAALLKSELDKDDVPEDVRQEFLEAKEQERKEQAQKQAQQQTYQSEQPVHQNRRVDNVDLAQRTLIDSLLSSAKPIQNSPQQQAYVPQTFPQQRASSLKQVHHQLGEQQQLQQQAYQAYVPQPPTQPSTMYSHAQSRVFNLQQKSSALPPGPPVVATRFFAPIPITPTLMTTALKNPRYSSPVPRYVIELAKKLQGDRSVQGIVRVSAKRGRGLPPIEYLYPVKG